MMEGGTGRIILAGFLLCFGLPPSAKSQNYSMETVQYDTVTGGIMHEEKKNIQPQCHGLCECFNQAMDNNSISPACFRIKGNSSHLTRQMRQANSENRLCEDVGEGTYFKCLGNAMFCVSVGKKITLHHESAEDEIFSSSSANDTIPDTSSESDIDSDDKSTLTYVTCDRIVSHEDGFEDVMLSCRIERNDSTPDICVDESMSRCHYKAVSKVDKDVKCPAGWDQLRKKCFLHVAESVPYDEAYDMCRFMAAYMVTRFEGYPRDLLTRDLAASGNSTSWAGRNGSAGCYVTDANQTRTLTSCQESHAYTCYQEVFKYLQCKGVPEAPADITTGISTFELGTTTRAPTTQESILLTTTTRSSVTVPGSPNTGSELSDEQQINAAKDAFQNAKEEISNYVLQFTNDSSTMAILDDIIESDSMGHEVVAEMVENVDNLVDSLAGAVTGAGQALIIESTQLVLKVVPVCTTCRQARSGPRLAVGISNDSYSVTVPAAAAANGVTAALSAVDALDDVMPANMAAESEESSDGVKGENVTYEIDSLVATVSVKKWDESDLELDDDHPFEITFSNKGNVIVANLKPNDRSCCYWKASGSMNGGGAWSTEGCVVYLTNATHTTCHCTHLTSFAVLMRVNQEGAVQSEQETKIQDYMTYVGCGLSIACLLTMLIVFTIQKLYRSDRNIIHMNLAFALLVSQAVFLFGIDRTEEWEVCKTIGISLHFFLLSTFFWMLVEGIYLISKTTSTKNKFLAMPTYILIGWGGPGVTVGITAGVSFDSYQVDEMCWLSYEDGGIWAFVGPAIGIVILNIFLLGQVIRVFLRLRTNMKKAHVERIWLALRAMLLTLPLLGITWLFGVLSFSIHTRFFSYIFIVLNSLQGVFIFVLYCVLNDEVKKVVGKKLSSIGRLSGRASNGRSTKSTT